MRLKFDQFNGIAPRTDDKLLNKQLAQVAENVNLLSGKLEPVLSPLRSFSLPSSNIKSIYPYNSTYLSWETDVDVIQSPIANDAYHRIYYTGDGPPKMKAIYDDVVETYDLAIQPPTSAPIITNPNIPGTLTSNTTLTISYVYAYVTKFGEESAPSPPSDLIDIVPTTNALVSGLLSPQPNDRAIVAIRIYRTAIGQTEAATFRFVDEIPLGTDGISTSYTDNKPQATLGATITTTLWNPPEEDLQGITVMAGGILCGFVGNTLHFSEPYLPNAWNPSYQIALDFDIVGIETTGNSLIVGTTQHPYIINGSRPDSLLPIKLAIVQPCLSKRGMIAVGSSVFFPGPDGMVAVTQGQASIVTKDIYTRSQWSELNPSTMISGTWDRNIYMFCENETIIMDIENRGIYISTSDEHTQGILTYYDSMYLIQDSYIYEWGRGDVTKYMTWKSAELSLDRVMDFSIARVIADDYPVALRIYSKESEVLEITINDDSAFRLPQLVPSRYWEFELESVFKVDELSVATSMGDFQ